MEYKDLVGKAYKMVDAATMHMIVGDLSWKYIGGRVLH